MPNNFRVEFYTVMALIIGWLIKKHFNLSIKMYIGLYFLLGIMFFQKLW